MKQIELWRKNTLGMGYWRIWNSPEEPNVVRYAHQVMSGGAEIAHSETVHTNQSGRTIEEQVDLVMNSRASRMMDKGYKRTRDEALHGATNQLGLLNPMLAQPLEKVNVTPAKLMRAYVQRKYDGHRCLITNHGGDIVAYSRKGNIISTVSHILEEVSRWIPDGVTLDGELYVHGLPLQTISSIVKRQQPDSVKLRYHWYDICDIYHRNYPFAERFDRMLFMGPSMENGPVELVPTYPVRTVEEAMSYFRTFRDEGYEGAILRLSTHPYQDAVRSASLIKLKEWHDCEVTVIGATQSKDGWAILRVRTDQGVEFDTSAPGSVPEKTEVWLNFQKYLGKRLTVEYASLTKDGVPFHCTALRWREDV